MLNRHFIHSRALLSCVALASLALLTACQTKPSDSAAPVAETAAVDPNGTGVSGITGGPLTDAQLETEMLKVGDRVRFELDQYELTPEAEATLQRQAKFLETQPQVIITIEGHADERGTREYNLALGERRADTVRNYLVALGVQPDRISVVSYGKERPECPEADEGCWSQNRRGVTVASQ